MPAARSLRRSLRRLPGSDRRPDQRQKRPNRPGLRR
jgi:hypothetical protein